MYITVACGMFGITLTLIHMQDAGHGISEGKCGVTMRHVDNWISRPRVAARTHTPKSCTYNTFMYILFGEIQKISLYFIGKVTGVRPTIC